MTAPISVFPSDRSSQWILVPGVASTRQIEIRNDSDAQIECHLRVEQPTAASASPAVLTIEPRHSRVADIIFLANWSPAQDRLAAVSVRDAQGEQLAGFSQELVAADSSDCSLRLELRDGVVIDNRLGGLKLWCTVTSRSSTPRRFEVDFAPHASLRFPERKTITLAPGESSAFEVPVQWNRAVRDVQGWNHPGVVEAYVPVGEGRRTAVLPWEQIQERFGEYLTPDDAAPKIAPTRPPTVARPTFMEKTPGQLKYEELVELKRLEQGVVASSQVRTAPTPAEPGFVAEPPKQRSPIGPLVTIGLALIALVVAGFFFLRPSATQTSGRPLSVTPLKLSPAPPAHATAHRTITRSASSNAALSQTEGAASGGTTQNVVTSQAAYAAGAAKKSAHPQAVAAAPKQKQVPEPPVDRSAVVALGGIEAGYAQGGRAVSVVWSGSAQASAIVQLLDFNGRVIASRTIRGNSTDTTLRLPRGYHGPLSVEVTAIGYHGERVVQGTSLAAQD